MQLAAHSCPIVVEQSTRLFKIWPVECGKELFSVRNVSLAYEVVVSNRTLIFP